MGGVVAKPAILTDLKLALQSLDLIRRCPLPAPEARIFRSTIANLQDIEAVLIAIDAAKPGVLYALEQMALEELQVEHDQPPNEITALIRRYCSRQEKLR